MCIESDAFNRVDHNKSFNFEHTIICPLDWLYTKIFYETYSIIHLTMSQWLLSFMFLAS